MQHIPTSPQAVSKLRKQAKLRVRGDSSLILANALEQVAKEAGYLHWQHVTICLANTVAMPAPGHVASLTLAQVFPGDANGRRQEQDFIIVRGESGIGKSLRGAQYALDRLKEGKPVHVLDVGRSYFHLCKLVGGSYVSFQRDGSRSDEEPGVTPFVVFDFEQALASKAWGPEGDEGKSLRAALQEIRTDALLIVDELWNVSKAMTGHAVLQETVQSHLTAGGSAVVLCQCGVDDRARESFCEGIRTRSTVRRTLIDLQRM